MNKAAPVFCAGYTVWSGLRWANPKPHERIAVVGIGGLGHLALQYSKAAGFETIAITHSKDKEELARKLGADVVVSDGQGLREAGGADVILATSNSYKAAADTLRFEARWKIDVYRGLRRAFYHTISGRIPRESPSDYWLQSER